MLGDGRRGAISARARELGPSGRARRTLEPSTTAAALGPPPATPRDSRGVTPRTMRHPAHAVSFPALGLGWARDDGAEKRSAGARRPARVGAPPPARRPDPLRGGVVERSRVAPTRGRREGTRADVPRVASLPDTVVSERPGRAGGAENINGHRARRPHYARVFSTIPRRARPRPRAPRGRRRRRPLLRPPRALAPVREEQRRHRRPHRGLAARRGGRVGGGGAHQGRPRREGVGDDGTHPRPKRRPSSPRGGSGGGGRVRGTPACLGTLVLDGRRGFAGSPRGGGGRGFGGVPPSKNPPVAALPRARDADRLRHLRGCAVEQDRRSRRRVRRAPRRARRAGPRRRRRLAAVRPVSRRRRHRRREHVLARRRRPDGQVLDRATEKVGVALRG